MVVVNTCTVTGEADHKARKAVRHALGLPQEPVGRRDRLPRGARCRGRSRALGDRVVVEADKDASSPRACASAPGDRALRPTPSVVAPAPRAGAASTRAPGEDRGRLRHLLRVLHRAVRAWRAAGGAACRRASPRSKRLVAAGVNGGRAHRHQHRPLRRRRCATCPALVEAIAATGIPRIRLSSIEPPDVDDPLPRSRCRRRPRSARTCTSRCSRARTACSPDGAPVRHRRVRRDGRARPRGASGHRAHDRRHRRLPR